jgi:hypothetical protein
MDAKVKEFVVQSTMSVDEQRLEEIKENTFMHITSLLATKGAEYSKKVNRLENFLAGAAMDKTTPEKALYDMLKKHWLSIQKFVNEVGEGVRHDPVKWAEKTDDIITYCILLKALVIQRYEIERVIDKKANEQLLKLQQLEYRWEGRDESQVDDVAVEEKTKVITDIFKPGEPAPIIEHLSPDERKSDDDEPPTPQGMRFA